MYSEVKSVVECWVSNVECISHTLRSWLHEMSALFMTLSPELEKNYTLEQSSDSFPGTAGISVTRSPPGGQYSHDRLMAKVSLPPSGQSSHSELCVS